MLAEGGDEFVIKNSPQPSRVVFDLGVSPFFSKVQHLLICVVVRISRSSGQRQRAMKSSPATIATAHCAAPTYKVAAEAMILTTEIALRRLNPRTVPRTVTKVQNMRRVGNSNLRLLLPKLIGKTRAGSSGRRI